MVTLAAPITCDFVFSYLRLPTKRAHFMVEPLMNSPKKQTAMVV